MEPLLRVEKRACLDWINNAAEHFKTYFLPVAGALLMSLAANPLILVVDGTVVGRGCVALYVGVVYRKKVLPIAWTVVAQEKGHLPESIHIHLMMKVQALVPEGAKVILLGDGELGTAADGTLSATLFFNTLIERFCRSRPQRALPQKPKLKSLN